MSRALERADLDTGNVAYLNAHGTGTVHNDAMEALAVARCFGKGYVPVNNGSIDFVSEIFSNFPRNLIGQVVPAVVHGKEHAFDSQLRVQVLLDQFNCVHEC